MSLETELKRLANAAERIADGLELLGKLEGGFKSIEQPEPEAETAAEPPAADAEPEESSSSEPASSDSTSSPETVPGPTSAEGEFTKEDVRDALKALGKRHDSGVARDLLRDVGKAKSLTDLNAGLFGTVIEAANAVE